ncbi:MAG: AAA family ATPase [Actinomycetales bacterium]|nr:AAA family ATPase [Actinomycetales bacterium]
MLTTLAVENYRSLRRLVIPLRRLTVITGANGSGKSNAYRALRLLAECARNGAVAALAREGGLASTLWAGPPLGRGSAGARRAPVGLRLGFAGTDVGYAVDLGLPVSRQTAFDLDPEIKRECVWAGPMLRPATLLADRRNGAVRIRDASGGWTDAGYGLPAVDSMLSELADPLRAPEVMALRERIRSWRFYDHFRTDAGAPARTAWVGTFTPVLGHDGADLAAALQTVREAGDPLLLDEAVEAAFPGSTLEVVAQGGRFDLAFHQRGLLRPLSVAELSDGTLRYLLWIAALLSPRPPELLVLNEPETSLHPELLPALARLVADASGRTQVLVVSHSAALVEAVVTGVSAGEHCQVLELVKEAGQTLVAGQERFDQPPWQWPAR